MNSPKKSLFKLDTPRRIADFARFRLMGFSSSEYILELLKNTEEKRKKNLERLITFKRIKCLYGEWYLGFLLIKDDGSLPVVRFRRDSWCFYLRLIWWSLEFRFPIHSRESWNKKTENLPE